VREEVIAQIKNFIKMSEKKEIELSIEDKLRLFLELGIILEQLGKLAKAETIYNKLKVMAEKAGKKEFLVEVYIGYGRIADIHGDKEKTLENFKKAAELAKQMEGELMEAKVSSLLGYVYSREGKPEEARELLENAFELIKTKMSNDEIREIAAKISVQLGLIEFRKGNFEDADSFFTLTLQLTEEANIKTKIQPLKC
jgi:tetratricopeptide (TPR) repeat protein